MLSFTRSLFFIGALLLIGLCLGLALNGCKSIATSPPGPPSPTSPVAGVSTAPPATQPPPPTPEPTTAKLLPSPTPLPSNTPVPTSTPIPTPSATPLPSPSVSGSLGGKWDLIFSDGFDSPQLDPKSWVTCYYWDNHGCTNSGNDELEWYLPQNVQISDGALKLTAKKETVHASDGKTYPYTSGMVTTGMSSSHRSDYYRFQFQYGFTEIRAKFASGKGLWPAFWLLPIDNSAKPEIDVMEIIGDAPNTVNMTLHFLHGSQHIQEGNAWSGPDLSNDWHTYGVDWEPDHITWYVDGVERWSYTDGNNIPHKPMYLLLNLAVGGDWPGSPDAETVFPSTFEIDYVRVWAPG